jgi:hypothetical protein
VDGYQQQVEARAAQLIAGEMTLRELRQARKLTQVRVARTPGIIQDSVSRLEKRSDLLLSTLRNTVEAVGGSPEACRWSRNAPIVRQSFCPALLETSAKVVRPMRAWTPGGGRKGPEARYALARSEPSKL